MPICIECRYPVSQLYHVLHGSNNNNNNNKSSQKSSATHPSTKTPQSGIERTSPANKKSTTASGGVSGGDVRLTQCPRCKRFADKYVEHDFVVLFIDLVLVKPQVYRHLLFNRLGRDDDEIDPSIIRLGTLLLLFDVYLTWSHIESLSSPNQTSTTPIPHLPILLQYTFYLLLCALTTLAQHLTIRWLASKSGLSAGGNTTAPTTEGSHSNNTNYNTVTNPPAPLKPATANGITTALFVSSCMKLFPVLMIVWKYDDAGGSVGRGVEWAVAMQNLEALRILLGCGYVAAAGLVAAGVGARWVVRGVVLGCVGLGEGIGFG